MAIQLYSKEFWNYYGEWEKAADVRNSVLSDVNEFFRWQDDVDIVEILEDWDDDDGCFTLVVYYKKYI